MPFRFRKLFLIVLILFGCTSVSIAQLELPFDYLYGRWVNGFYFEGSIRFKDFDIDNLSGDNTFSFTNNSLQVKVAGLGNHILWDEIDWGNNSTTKKSPLVDVKFRPNKKWQIRVDNFEISNSDYSFNFKSIYMSDSTIKISETHTPYAYIYKNILSKGNYILENRFNYRKSYSYDIDIINTIQYGLTDDINLSARITANEIESVSSFSPSYSFSVLSGLLTPFYVEMSIAQNFWDSKLKKRYLTALNMNMTYISKGKFDQNVIIADYNNYYKKMLFQSQFLLSLDIKTREIDTHNYNHENEDFWMQLNSAYGITSKINVESQINYSNYYHKAISSYYERFNGYVEKTEIFSSEKLSLQLSVSYFSHPYSSTPTNKWNSDSKYDIMFGNILKAKEYYMQFSFSPPRYSVNDEKRLDVLGFHDLKSNENYTLNFLSNVGVGKLTELMFQLEYRHFRNQDSQYQFEIGAKKRIYDKLNFSFDLSKSFSKGYIFNPYRINGSIFLLL